ncbi:hypothetical protein BJY24_006942 [Nocardia transvalensis]|uniref:Uncharacterized protein n=1 Tax=Nocardia transvalensis TaxID=37333 RepID=A0A7W9UMQ8_9NOCA|nr:hypothetical protein [Nocardia transvalensis]MBB5918030.1 hypothetical protein [Nocardia transvalensis]
MMKRTVTAALAAVAASLFAFGQSGAQDQAANQFVIFENTVPIVTVPEPADNTCNANVITIDAPRTVYLANTTPLYATVYARAGDKPECTGTVLYRFAPGQVSGTANVLQGAVLDVKFSQYS